jgi:hypothetical protein
LVFGVVSAQLQGLLNLLLRRSLTKKPKILAPKWLQYFFNRSSSANGKQNQRAELVLGASLSGAHGVTRTE